MLKMASTMKTFILNMLDEFIKGGYVHFLILHNAVDWEEVLCMYLRGFLLLNQKVQLKFVQDCLSGQSCQPL
jgi:hypothetical protein